MKHNKAPEPKPTRWEVVYEDDDIRSTWKYNTKVTKFGPVEVEDVYKKRSSNKDAKKRGRPPKVKSLLLIAFLAAASFVSCTSNEMARKYGGETTINLEQGQRLVNVTWKENDLWVLTRKDTTWPKTYTFSEKSSYGILEGEITIVEK